MRIRRRHSEGRPHVWAPASQGGVGGDQGIPKFRYGLLEGEMRLSVLGLCHFGGYRVAFQKVFRNPPSYSLDKRNDKVVGCLGLIYNLIK